MLAGQPMSVNSHSTAMWPSTGNHGMHPLECALVNRAGDVRGLRPAALRPVHRGGSRAPQSQYRPDARVFARPTGETFTEVGPRVPGHGRAPRGAAACRNAGFRPRISIHRDSGAPASGHSLSASPARVVSRSGAGVSRVSAGRSGGVRVARVSAVRAVEQGTVAGAPAVVRGIDAAQTGRQC